MTKALTFITLTLTSLMTWQFSTPNVLSLTRSKKIPLTLPEEYQEMHLIPCSLSKLEQEFAKQFPGTLKTYRHQQGVIIFRQVKGATRKLHESRVCLEASGFRLCAPKMETDSSGKIWQTYSAQNRKNKLRVRSIILSCSGEKSWPSVEKWFWSAFFSRPDEVYLAITEIRNNYLW